MIKETFNRSVTEIASADFATLGVDVFRAAIVAERPDIDPADLQEPAQPGQLSLTLMTDTEVFKAPNGVIESLPDLLREIAVLKFMTTHDVPYTPRLKMVSEHGWFFGMTRMPGVTLTELNEQEKLGRNDWCDMAREIGAVQAKIDAHLRRHNLYAQLPSVPVAGDLTEPDGDMEAIAQVWHTPDVQKVLYYLPEQVRTELDDYMTRYRARAPALNHCDLNRRNLLVDPDTRKVTGMIDLGRIRATTDIETMLDNSRWAPEYCKSDLFNAYAEKRDDMQARDFHVNFLLTGVRSWLDYDRTNSRECAKAIMSYYRPAQ